MVTKSEIDEKALMATIEKLKDFSCQISEKGYFILSTEFDLIIYASLKDLLDTFQYSPNKDNLCAFLNADGEQENCKKLYAQMLNNYVFIPINTILKSTMRNKSKYSVNTFWFRADEMLSPYIRVEITDLCGQYLGDVIGTLSNFFGKENLEITRIVSESFEEFPTIESDVEYWVYINIYPKNFDPLGIIKNDISQINEIAALQATPDEERKNAIKQVLTETYLPWVLSAQNELYNWIMSFQNEYLSVPLEKNKFLKENQESYEIVLNETCPQKPIDFKKVIKRSFPGIEIQTKRYKESLKLKFSQNLVKLENIL